MQCNVCSASCALGGPVDCPYGKVERDFSWNDPAKIKFEIGPEAQQLAQLLISQGWEFCLTYSEPMLGREGVPSGEGQLVWEADFTRRKVDGLWDNHEAGVHPTDPSAAITEAYQNVVEGKRVGVE